MKKFAIAALLTALTFSMNAQVISEDDRADFRNIIIENAKYHKHIADNHITDIKQYSYSKKHPEGIMISEQKYNSHGNIIEYINWNKHGRITYHYKYQYNDSNRITSNIDFNKKGKPRWGYFWSYDKSGNITRNCYWYKDTGNTNYCVITYDSKNNPTSAKFYYSKGRLYSSVVYEYYDDGSKKKTTSYNRKGKVTAVWNYDCNPIGKLQESKMKDTSKVCVHYETDKNGNPIKVKEEYTEGGRLFKYRLREISKYDKDDHLIEYIATKMNGEETIHNCADFDAQGNETEWRQYVPNTTNIKKRVVYNYNNSGDIVQAIVYSKSSPKGAILKYVYN